jgi:hypothetical protein
MVGIGQEVKRQGIDEIKISNAVQKMEYIQEAELLLLCCFDTKYEQNLDDGC